MDTLSFIIIATLVIALIYLLTQFLSLKGKEEKLKGEMAQLAGNVQQVESKYRVTNAETESKHKITISDIEDRYRTVITELERQIQAKAQEQYQSWVEKECASIRAQQIEVAKREAVTLLEQWKYEAEILIRHDAIQRSQAVIVGKVTEHLVPYLPKFKYNPKDARFIGSPVDLLVFDGLDNGHLENIVFVEVKTGTSSRLTRREQQIRDAINQGRVKWVSMRVKHNQQDE